MFYSHEVLTSRKYGFATVWLVATMGSGTKKVTRKAILDVDVSKTCETIVAPTVPLALRLQSSLLYGVTRVYAQQCGFVLQDVENARNQMRTVLKSVQTSGLSAEGANKARSDYLVLADDPSFLPDFDLTLADLALTTEDEQHSYLTTTASLLASDSQRTPYRSAELRLSDDLQLGLLHSPSSAIRLSDMLDRSLGMADSTSRRPGRQDTDQLPQYQGLQEDLGLMFGDDGNANAGELAILQEDGRMASVQSFVDRLQEDADLPLDDHQDIESMDHNGPVNTTDRAFVDNSLITTSETAQASLRAHKSKKTMPLDQAIELSRRELKLQQDNYLANMQREVAHKQTLANVTTAKKNVECLIYDIHASTHNPLSIFSGMSLLSMVARTDFGDSLKRARDETPHPELARRVRAREDDNDMIPSHQDDTYMPDYNEIEQGREQQTPLDDLRQSTLLPWNQSTGSRRPGSSHAAMSFGHERPRFSSMRGYTASPLAAQPLQTSIDVADMSPAVVRSVAQDAPQNATESQWLRSALHDESMNFLGFVEDAMQRRAERSIDKGVDMSAASIDFGELLSVANHSYVVAAQAFLHVLVLGTKNLLQAEQGVSFGNINIRLV